MKFLVCLFFISASAFSMDLFSTQKTSKPYEIEIHSVPYGDCNITAIVVADKKKSVLKIITTMKRVTSTMFTCTVSKEQYVAALKIFAPKVKKEKITEFVTGYDQNPADDEWKLKLGLASVKNENFKKVLRDGEKNITLNDVFTEIIKENKVFDSFIELHKHLKLNLVYLKVEKVFREVVKHSPDREMMKKAGLNDQDRYISGAGIITFKVMP